MLSNLIDQKRNGRLPFSLRQRPCNFAGAVDEKLRDRAERAVLQSDDPDWHAAYRQFEGQLVDLRAPGRKSQRGSRDNRHKTPCRR